MKKTIIVNLFAGPGAGKSTGASYVFSKLKMEGFDAEYVSEFAKDMVWENNSKAFNCQFYITGNQVFRIYKVYGEVDVIVTDSPIALGVFYSGQDKDELNLAILEEFKKYNNLNFFINRKKEFNSNGRNQTEQESINIDKDILKLLNDNNIEFTKVDGDSEGYDQIIEIVKSHIDNKK